MKKRSIIGIAIIISLFIIFYLACFTRVSEGWFGKLWNIWSMRDANCSIQRGYFIDRDNDIQFKLPTDTYAAGVYTHGGRANSRHLDLSWYRNSPLYSEYLLKVYYNKVSGDPRGMIDKAIIREVKHVTTSENFKNVEIEVKDLSYTTKHGFLGRLVYSLEWKSPPGERRTDEIRYIMKDEFIVSIEYANYKKIFDRLDKTLLNAMFDKLLTSFSSSQRLD